MISSTSNSQIKNIIQLQKKGKLRSEQGVFVVEGVKMVREALDHQLVKAYVSETYYEDLRENEDDFLKRLDYEIVTNQIFKQMSDTITPQGILALVTMPKYSLEDLLGFDNANLLILEDIRDPGNLGTMVRTAEGAGITGIILSQESVDIFNPKVIRSTMGSIYRVPFFYAANLVETIETLKNKGITLYAAHLNGKNNYDEEVYEKRSGLLIGNEANGISSEIAMRADRLVKIPMEGKLESLNAAIAAGILMYELARQRR